MSSRTILSYDDLPHDPNAVSSAAPHLVTDSKTLTKKGKRKRPSSSSLPIHWDQPSIPSIPNQEEDDDDMSISSSSSKSAVVIGTCLPILGSGGGSGSGNRKKGHQKPLSHNEIWDDSALVNAWESAQQEYLIFHHHRLHNLSSSSPLWNDSPKVGSHLANQIKQSAIHHHSKKKKPNSSDTVKPQQQVSSNHSAWLEAVETVEKTIAKSKNESVSQDQVVPPSLPPSESSSESFQNVVMAWYWVGYYTALHHNQTNSSSSSAPKQD